MQVSSKTSAAPDLALQLASQADYFVQVVFVLMIGQRSYCLGKESSQSNSRCSFAPQKARSRVRSYLFAGELLH